MLSPDQIAAAIAYNVRKSGVLWKAGELPMPFGGKDNCLNPASKEFALAVAKFQEDHALEGVDGKLGPATLSTIRAVAMQDAAAAGVVLPMLDPSVPARTGVSNQIVVNGQRVLLPQPYLDAGITCSNWIDDADAHEDVHFVGKTRNGSVTHIVIHESVTNSVPGTVDVLAAQGYGVHFMIAPDGHITCHNDPVKEYVIHGNQLNGKSVGIEIINPYSPKYDKKPYEATIPAQWWTWVPKDGPKLYCLPTNAQLKALRALTVWLCNLIPTLPLAFPTKDLNAKHKKIDGWNKPTYAKPGPGIVAHSDYASHADGRYELEFLANAPKEFERDIRYFGHEKAWAVPAPKKPRTRKVK